MFADLEFRLVIFDQNIVPIAWKAEVLMVADGHYA